MKKVVVKITWSRSKYLPMAALAHATVTKMTNNTNFTTPKVALTVMEAAATKVEVSYGNRKDGQVGKDDLLKSSTELDSLMRDQAEYVTDIAIEDETIIHSAGFESVVTTRSKPPQLKQVLAGPLLETKVGGSVKATSPKIAGAKEYFFILVETGPFDVTVKGNGQIYIPTGTIAHVISGTKHIVTFTQINSKIDVYVKVMTKNSVGYSNLSPATCIQTLS